MQTMRVISAGGQCPALSGTRTRQWRGLQAGTWLTRTVSLRGYYHRQRKLTQWAWHSNLLCTDKIAAVTHWKWFQIAFSPRVTFCRLGTYLQLWWRVQTINSEKKQKTKPGILSLQNNFRLQIRIMSPNISEIMCIVVYKNGNVDLF